MKWIKEFWVNRKRDWKYGGKLARTGLIAIPLLVVAFLVFGVSYVVDYSTGYNEHVDTAIVVGKEYTPSRTTVSRGVDSNGNSTTHYSHRSEEFHVMARGQLDNYLNRVDKEFYFEVSEGDTLFVVGRIGGVSGKCVRTWFSTDLTKGNLGDYQAEVRVRIEVGG